MYLKSLILSTFRFRTFLFLTASALLNFSCDKDSGPGEWQSLQEFPGKYQYFTTALYNDKCFVFFGERQDDLDSRTNTTNVWMYDLEQNTWSPRKFFNGAGPRKNASSFTIGDDVYVIGGVRPRETQPDSELNEFLHYDPSTDQWTELNPFPGEPRSGALSFVIDGKAYFGLGSSGVLPLRDFWQYDPVSTEWRKLSDFPGSFPERYYESYNVSNVSSRLTNFVHGNNVIIISGVDSQHPEMWSFNSTTEEWTRITDIHFEDDEAKEFYDVYSGAISITYKDMGYVILGVELNTEIGNPSAYRYDFSTSTWKTAGYFPGRARAGAFSFTTDDAIIFGTDYNPYNAETGVYTNVRPYESWLYRPKP